MHEQQDWSCPRQSSSGWWILLQSRTRGRQEETQETNHTSSTTARLRYKQGCKPPQGVQGQSCRTGIQTGYQLGRTTVIQAHITSHKQCKTTVQPNNATMDYHGTTRPVTFHGIYGTQGLHPNRRVHQMETTPYRRLGTKSQITHRYESTTTPTAPSTRPH